MNDLSVYIIVNVGTVASLDEEGAQKKNNFFLKLAGLGWTYHVERGEP
jgi:hypothetical protein